jgi:hypothetical protein
MAAAYLFLVRRMCAFELMTPQSTAAIGFRIIAAWIMLQTVFALGTIVFVATIGLPAPRASAPATGTALAPAQPRIHDQATASFLYRSLIPDATLHLVAGLTLFFASKPLGRLFARRVD